MTGGRPRGRRTHEVPWNFGANLRWLRRECSLSMNKVAQSIGVSRQLLSDIELGNRPPSDRVFEALQSYFEEAIHAQQQRHQ